MTTIDILLVFVCSMATTTMASTAIKVFVRFGPFAQQSMSAWGMSIISAAIVVLGYTHAVQALGPGLILAVILGVVVGMLVVRRNPAWERYLRSPDAAERQRETRMSWLIGLVSIAAGTMVLFSGLDPMILEPMIVVATWGLVFGAMSILGALSLSWPRPVLWPILIYFAPLLGLGISGWVAVRYPLSQTFQNAGIALLAIILAWPFFMFRWRYLFVK